MVDGQAWSLEMTAIVEGEDEEEAGERSICQTIVVVNFKDWIVLFCSAMCFRKRSCQKTSCWTTKWRSLDIQKAHSLTPLPSRYSPPPPRSTS